MGLGVFIHRSDSIYDDSPAERYQFPNQYYGRVQACVGGWIIYYEPSKVPATRGYFAVARVQKVVADPTAANMHLAIMEAGSYLDFANPVPFRSEDGVIERGLLNEAGQISGRAQAAVRSISPADFDRIVERGTALDQRLLPRSETERPASGFDEEQTPFQDEVRDRTSYFGSRITRDRVFRQVILRAYDERCAVTGLKLINGGGRAEVEAAHVRPVEQNGPDIVNNGIALCGTAHWMFDRGLISLSDKLRILVSRQVNDLEAVHSMINTTGHLLMPIRPADRPHPTFLKWHRENRFKQ